MDIEGVIAGLHIVVAAIPDPIRVTKITTATMPRECNETPTARLLVVHTQKGTSRDDTLVLQQESPAVRVAAM